MVYYLYGNSDMTLIAGAYMMSPPLLLGVTGFITFFGIVIYLIIVWWQP